MNHNITSITSKVKNLRFSIIILALLVLVSTTFTIIPPLLISYIIDNYITNGQYEGANIPLVLLFCIYFVQVTASFWSTIKVGNLSQEIIYELCNQVFAKIQTFKLGFFLENKSGDIISRVNNDTRKIDNFLSRYMFDFISSFFVFVGIGLFIFTQSFILATLNWILILILIIFSKVVGNMITKASKEQLESNSNITTFLNQNITNYKAVVVFNQQQNIDNDFKLLIEDNYKKNLKAKILTGMFRPIYNFVGLLAQVMVAIVGIYLVNQQVLTTGVLVGFILYTVQFYQPIVRLASVYSSFQQAKGAWIRICEILDLDKDQGNQILTVSYDNLSKDINE